MSNDTVTHYRKCTLGVCLRDALDELVTDGTLPSELATKVMSQFDKSLCKAIDKKPETKVPNTKIKVFTTVLIFPLLTCCRENFTVIEMLTKSGHLEYKTAPSQQGKLLTTWMR